MSQKSSVMQLPQFVPKALTSDTRHIDRLLTEAKEEFSVKPGRRRNDLTDKKPVNKPKKED